MKSGAPRAPQPIEEGSIALSGTRLRGGEELGRVTAPPSVRTVDVGDVRSDPFRPGEIIASKYVIERVVGVGGMGVVVAARHAELGEIVAIKFLRPEVLAMPAVVARFAREARSAAR